MARFWLPLVALLVGSLPVFAENNGGNYTLFIPTKYHNNDLDTDGKSQRYDAQRLREKRQSVEGIGARIAEFEDLLVDLKPGESFVLHEYFPHDMPDDQRLAEIAKMQAEWNANPKLSKHPLQIEPRFIDRLPRNLTRDEALANGLTPEEYELAIKQPAPTQNLPTDKWEKLKQPAVARKVKHGTAVANTAALGAFRGTILPLLNPLTWATLAIDLPIEYLYKNYQIPFSNWLGTHGLPLASRFKGSAYERASLWYQGKGEGQSKQGGEKMRSAKVFFWNLALLFASRPLLIDTLSKLALGHDATPDPAFAVSLAFGGIVLLPMFLKGYYGYEQLRQKGYITDGQRKLKMLRGASFSLGSLMFASSGLDWMRYFLPFSLIGENAPYLYTSGQAKKKAAKRNVFVLVHPSVEKNTLDLNDYEATEVTRDITGKAAEPIVSDARDNWKEIQEPDIKPGWFRRQARRFACGIGLLVSKREVPAS